jgi:predicted MPP superfamily phosphohydrolase
VVQLNLVLLNIVAHAVLGWVGVYWFGFAWWPYFVVPLWAVTALLTLQTCFPDKPVGPIAAVLREACMLHSSTVIMATPPLLLLALCLAFGFEAPAPFDRRALSLGCYGASLLLSAWAVLVCRRWVRVTHITVAAVGLPPEFDGYTIAHMSDLHVGSTDSRQVAERWAALANRYEPDLTVITGDLVTKGTAFYADVCAAVAGLEARDGVCVCFGNHDLYQAQALQHGLERVGALVLRNRWHPLVREGATLIVAGVDPGGSLEVALSNRPDDCYTVLLAHYPEVFDKLKGLQVELVLSGHTHGGQIGVPWFGDRVNVATVMGQHGRGLVERGSSRLFVSAGLGTTGVPFRLGVRPELALLELRRASPALSRPPPD